MLALPMSLATNWSKNCLENKDISCVALSQSPGIMPNINK
jgi:hypothetical protein